MTKAAIQEATASILTAYFTRHEVETHRVPQLIASVSQALTLGAETTDGPEPIAPVRRPRRSRAQQTEGQDNRIDDPDQSDLLELVTAPVIAEALLGETAGGGEPEIWSESEVTVPPKKGPRSRRSVAESQAEVTEEAGVTITRIPEVRRSRKRGG